MTNHRWQYLGDMNLEYGGLFFKEDDAEDYVRAVKVTPCSDGGGPNNLYIVEQGSIFMPIDNESRKRALSTIGAEIETATRIDLICAFDAYHGIEQDSMNGQVIIQIGKAEESQPNGVSPEPDYVLRGNTSLKRYIRREFLS